MEPDKISQVLLFSKTFAQKTATEAWVYFSFAVSQGVPSLPPPALICVCVCVFSFSLPFKNTASTPVSCCCCCSDWLLLPLASSFSFCLVPGLLVSMTNTPTSPVRCRVRFVVFETCNFETASELLKNFPLFYLPFKCVAQEGLSVW